MKSRKLESLLGNIRSLIADDMRDRKDYSLVHAVGDLSVFLYQMPADVAATRAILEVTCQLRASTGPGSRVAEERLMSSLQNLAWRCRGGLEDAGVARLPGFSAITQAPPEIQPTLHVLRELHDFALTCFAFKRSRDSFSSRRRAMAFDILGEIGRTIDLPEIVSLARQALRKARSVEAGQAADFLSHYFTTRDEAPDDETMADLLALSKRTDARSTVFSALNALVETGRISEFEAIDRMDDWKSGH
jgi:hypothetical protein